MVSKISSLCTSYRTKLSLTVKTDDVTKGRKDVDPHGRYGRFTGEWVKQIKLARGEGVAKNDNSRNSLYSNYYTNT